MVMNNTWMNSDGLYVKFGATEGVSRTQGGWVCQYGPIASYFLSLDLTSLDANENIQNDVLIIPKDSLILSVETYAIVGAATGTAIDVGLIATTRVTTTDLNASVADADPNGLLAAFEDGDMAAAGEYRAFYETDTFPASTTGSGALIGQILTVPTLITASRTDGTAFTAGKLLLRVNVIPEADTGFTQTHVG